MTNKRGGYRKGAGRPINSGKHGKPTTVVRVPCDFDLQQVQKRIDALEKNLEIRNLALHWMANGGGGASAKTALFHILGIPQKEMFKSYPADTDDILRVFEMIDSVGLHDCIGSLAVIDEKWRAIVGMWATLERLATSDNIKDRQKAHNLLWDAYAKAGK